LKKYNGKVFVRKKWVSGSMSRSFEGHNVAYQCKGPDLSNEVNPLNNDKVITEIQTFNAK